MEKKVSKPDENKPLPQNKAEDQTQDKDALSDEEIDSVHGGVTAPRDVSTGQATGRRIEKPIRWMTPVGTASA